MKMGHKVPKVLKGENRSLSQPIQRFQSGTGDCRGLVALQLTNWQSRKPFFFFFPQSQKHLSRRGKNKGSAIVQMLFLFLEVCFSSLHLLLMLAESFCVKVKAQREGTQGSSREGREGFGTGKGRRTDSENKTEISFDLP